MTSSSDASVAEQALRIAARVARASSSPSSGPPRAARRLSRSRSPSALGGEIISADSVQIYRGFDVGSGKPTADELARAPHHLVGRSIRSIPSTPRPGRRLAEAAIADVRARGRVPIVCGGTFLWVKALLFGLAAAPAASPEMRERHRAIVEARRAPCAPRAPARGRRRDRRAPAPERFRPGQPRARGPRAHAASR